MAIDAELSVVSLDVILERVLWKRWEGEKKTSEQASDDKRWRDAAWRVREEDELHALRLSLFLSWFPR